MNIRLQTWTGDQLSNVSMNLLGMPHQFTKAVDPRVKSVSNDIGKKFLENMVVEAPVVTIIPGIPLYMSDDNLRDTFGGTSQALISAANGNFAPLYQAMADNDKVKFARLYDFKPDYAHYMNYVNALCRAGATFLGLTDTIQVGKVEFTFQKYDWRAYKWNKTAESNAIAQIFSYVFGDDGGEKWTPADDMVNVKTESEKAKDYKEFTKKDEKKLKQKLKKEGKKPAEIKKAVNKEKKKDNKQAKKKAKAASKDNKKTAKRLASYGLTDDVIAEANSTTSSMFALGSGKIKEASYNEKGYFNYVQFYIDPDTGFGEDMSNATAESQLKSTISGLEGMQKEIAFLANSTGSGSTANKVFEFAGSTFEALASGVGAVGDFTGLSNLTGGAISRLLNLSKNVIQGENIIMPDIYQSSQYSKSYSLTIHLRSPYGTTLGYYLNIFVPLMHLMALVVPRQGTANTYQSPFLVKVYVEGMFTCNLGIVTSMSINRNTESFSYDGLPLEVDVTLQIQDLYSDMMLSSSTDPIMFINNSSLIEFLATNCGLSLIKPMGESKFEAYANTIAAAIDPVNIFENAMAAVGESVQSKAESAITIVDMVKKMIAGESLSGATAVAYE